MKYWPQSTRCVAMDGSGRDTLGLSRMSDGLTNFLLPNIIKTTLCELLLPTAQTFDAAN
jgi:hypothetical protein